MTDGDALMEELKSLAKDINVPCWIPVTERLPGDYETVLTHRKKHEYYNVCYYDPHWCEFYTMNDTIWGNVTHWMPLPEAPKE